MQIINCFKLSFNIAPGIIVDEEVEEEVKGRLPWASLGSRKWTDRALMLQSGLLTAVEVEEREKCVGLQRIRAR